MTALTGKVAVVTGASSGIGRATAVALAGAGCDVAVADVEEQGLRQVAQQIEALGRRVLARVTNVGYREQVEGLLNETVAQLGRVDLLVNAAGYGRFQTFESTPLEEIERLLAVNFLAHVYAIKAALPIMRRQGSGHIINVASVVGQRALPLQATYSAAKAAIIGLSEALRVELRGSGIRVSTILPAATRTEFFVKATGGRITDPPGPPWFWHTPERVAQAIVNCARRPKRQVALRPRLQLFYALVVLFPGLGDWGVRRFLRRYHAVLTDDAHRPQEP